MLVGERVFPREMRESYAFHWDGRNLGLWHDFAVRNRILDWEVVCKLGTLQLIVEHRPMKPGSWLIFTIGDEKNFVAIQGQEEFTKRYEFR